MLTGLAAATLAPLSRAVAAPAAAGEPLWYVHPELRPAAAAMLRMIGSFPPPSDATLKLMRGAGGSLLGKPLATVPFEKRVIPGRSGAAQDVVIYVINAKPGTRRPGLLHTHGGGFIAGTAVSNVTSLQDLATKLDCAIVTVDYRLAPETRYSGSVEDNYSGLRWLHDNAEQLGVDPARIAVMGESAGGGHAALLAITARNRGEVPLAFQCLVYPMLDDRTGSSRPVQGHVGTIMWTAEQNRYGWRSFLGQEPGTGTVPVAAVPAREANLAGLPPAWIGVGSIDLFAAEDMAYAQRLMAADVMTELVVAPGAFHGFDVLGGKGTSIEQAFTAAKIRALKRALAPTTA
jgi:acetyl esterase/lipase